MSLWSGSFVNQFWGRCRLTRESLSMHFCRLFICSRLCFLLIENSLQGKFSAGLATIYYQLIKQKSEWLTCFIMMMVKRCLWKLLVSDSPCTMRNRMCGDVYVCLWYTCEHPCEMAEQVKAMGRTHLMEEVSWIYTQNTETTRKGYKNSHLLNNLLFLLMLLFSKKLI